MMNNALDNALDKYNNALLNTRLNHSHKPSTPDFCLSLSLRTHIDFLIL